jgi:hypothetical protein
MMQRHYQNKYEKKLEEIGNKFDKLRDCKSFDVPAYGEDFNKFPVAELLAEALRTLDACQDELEAAKMDNLKLNTKLIAINKSYNAKPIKQDTKFKFLRGWV